MQSKTVAIITDEQTCRQTLRAILTEAGYAVLEQGTSDHDASLDGVDAICLHLTGEAGFAALGRLGARCPGVPVLAVGQPEVVSRAVEAGAYDFVAFPIMVMPFRCRVAHAIEHRQLNEKVKTLSTQLASQQSPDDDEVVPLRVLERQAIERALRATSGSVTKAAKLLGIGRATLYRRLASPEMAGLRPRRGYTRSSASMSTMNHSSIVAAASERA